MTIVVFSLKWYNVRLYLGSSVGLVLPVLHHPCGVSFVVNFYRRQKKKLLRLLPKMPNLELYATVRALSLTKKRVRERKQRQAKDTLLHLSDSLLDAPSHRRLII